MKKIIAFSVSLLSILSVSMLQSCSSTDDSNNLPKSQNVGINEVNLDKKWLTTFYAFTPSVSQASKTAYQLSSVEVDLNNGNYTMYDRYSEKKDKGTYSLDKNILTLVSTEYQETLRLKIDKLTPNEIYLTAIGHKDLLSIELISIK
ncbi:hypothetical protein [Myroides marinus]|uniref:hypothetical protein n=1 Tax=Myroides marinus TaxID=703342 RepID=UPI0025784137|nr:hypothetical protein [Myroides marinus]MDM1346044.1 hypothetical protein [Myroides marinus]MDM1353298.1 hypothetical protein [Myroides marinus]